jgi:hypothetical protein
MSRGYILTSPNAIGLPAAERSNAPPPRTRALVDARWPAIERLLDQGDAAAALAAMETLARAMQEATAGDPPLYRPALKLARQVLYDDIAEVGRTAGLAEATRAALDRCAAWDAELRGHIEALRSS